tara:strand:+ start:472 stop:612 length:141 start_codon:yes stop_codon:yes gene_type:complete
MFISIVDTGQKGNRIQPHFFGSEVPTSKDETIYLRLNEVDGEEGIL